MEMADAGRVQHAALFRGHGGGHQPAGRRIVVQALEQLAHPGRQRGPAGGAELDHPAVIGHRQDAGLDGNRDAGGPGAVHESQVGAGVEKELGDGAAGAGVDLALEVVQVGRRAGRLGMGFGIGGDADLEIGDLLQARHQVGGVGVAAGMGPVGARALGRIAAQGHDVADSLLPIAPGDGVHLARRGPDAGQVGGGFQGRLAEDPGEGGVGALAGGAAGAVSDRDEGGSHRRQPLHRVPQGLLHLLGLGREEFEGHGDVPGKGRRDGAFRKLLQHLVHGAASLAPSHTVTVKGSPGR